MPRRKHVIEKASSKPYKVVKLRLDQHTVITLTGTRMLDFWKHRYPGAHVVG